MKRPLAAAARGPLGATFVVCLVLVGARQAWADDYVVVRGAYYREASTRVIQPMVELQRESPSGVDVGAHFLVDAITSASIAAGTSVDNVFTEVRDEVGLRVRKRWERSDATLSYRYSAESDYWSHSIGASFGTRFWDDTATLRLSLGRSFDTMSAKGRTPDCRPNMPAQFCTLNIWFAGVSYSQVLSPVAIAQISYETAYLDGFQGNLYRMVSSLMRYEYLPEQRMRNAITPRIAYYLPRSQTGFQLHYRFYFDFYPGEHATPSDPVVLDRAHDRGARVPAAHADRRGAAAAPLLPPEPRPLLVRRAPAVAAGPHGVLRGRHRSARRLPTDAHYYTADPKLGPVTTTYPEVKLVWDADALRDGAVPALVLRRHLRDLLRLLLPEHLLRQRAPAADRLPAAVLDCCDMGTRVDSAPAQAAAGRSARATCARRSCGRARPGRRSSRCCWGRCS